MDACIDMAVAWLAVRLILISPDFWASAKAAWPGRDKFLDSSFFHLNQDFFLPPDSFIGKELKFVVAVLSSKIYVLNLQRQSKKSNKILFS